MAKGEGRDMRLKILACRHVYHGRNQRNDEYDVYEVDAANAQGQKINEKLRAFTALPIGHEVDVTVTVFNSEKWGKSYTLHPKGRSGGGSTQRVNELAELCEQLKGMIANLTTRVDALEAMVSRRPPADAGLMSRTTPNSEELDARFGAEPPDGQTW